MSSNTEKVGEFVAEQLERQDGRLVKLVCVQLINGNRIGDELRTITIPPEPDAEWRQLTAAKIVDKATEEATELGKGIQRYAVQAWFEAEDRSRARIVFTCRGEDAAARDSLSTEGPDAEGLAAQAMRHTEFFAQLSFRERSQITKDLQDECSRLRRDNEQLRSEQFRSIDKVRQIMLADADRAATERREAAKTRLIEGSVEKIELFLPHAINAWSMSKYGKLIFPEAATQMVAAKTFVDSITDADLAKIRAAIGEEKAAGLVQFATSISKMPPDPSKEAAPAGRELGADLVGRLEAMALNGAAHP